MKQTDEIFAAFRKSLLAAGMGDEDSREFLSSSQVRLLNCAQGDIVFHDGDIPKGLYVLLSGEVHIQKDSFLGRKIFLSGDIFGEVYLLLRKPYDIYVEARKNTRLLSIGSEAFSLSQMEASPACRLVQQNLMRILARKAYFMHNKLKVMASGSLREKIARFLFWEMDKTGTVQLSISREAWADYLSVARPSLSRELSAMQSEGILSVKGKRIQVMDRARFEEYL